MSKLRNDSTWNQLTPEQRVTLETWLFDENLGYADTVERLRRDFGLQTTTSSVGRFRRRRAAERQAEDLAEAQAAALQELPNLRAYLKALENDTDLTCDEKLDRLRTFLYGWDSPTPAASGVPMRPALGRRGGPIVGCRRAAQ